MLVPQSPQAPGTVNKYWPVLGLIACNILIGLLVFRDYGLTTDEPLNMRYANYVIDYLRSDVGMEYPLFKEGNLDQKGPAYFVAAKIFATLGHSLIPAVSEIAFWHLADFLLFQLAVFCLFDLSLRWMDPWGAFGAALLFATQPLFWGHAFVNPKDSPFMVLFLASVTFGLRMADRVLASETWVNPTEALARTDLSQVPPEAKSWTGKALISFGGLVLVALLAGVAFTFRSTIVASLVGNIQELASTNPIRVGYTNLAASPVLDTIKKYLLGDKGFLTGFIVVAVVAAVLILGAAVLSSKWPDQERWFRRKLSGSFRDSRVLWAGILLGLTISIRILGPYAGALVALWMLIRGRWKAVPAVLAYVLTALLVAYVTWPFLWKNPVTRFLDSAGLMSDYPWQGRQLFGGQLYSARHLPALYTPTLMAIQLTEPVWILFALSLIVVGYKFVKNRSGLDLILLLFCWLVLPAFLIVVTHRPIYNNIRQLHFLLPPVFVFAGVAISLIAGKLKAPWLRVALLAALAFPGILAIVQLHPYEYVYYNSYVGGPPGAFREFEADYWLSSVAEAAMYVNQTVPKGSTIILVGGPVTLLEPYISKDLKVSSFDPSDAVQENAYFLVSTRRNQDLQSLKGDNTIHVIGRRGMTFMIIRDVSSSR